MRRNYYSDYAEHCIRYYARNPRPVFENYVQANNWSAVDKTLHYISPNNKKMVLAIFRGGDTLADNVYQYSKKNNIPQDGIWKVINHTLKTVAKKRGLL